MEGSTTSFFASLFSSIFSPDLFPHLLCYSYIGLPAAPRVHSHFIVLWELHKPCLYLKWFLSLPLPTVNSSPSFHCKLVIKSIRMAAPISQIRFPNCILLWYHVPPLPSTFHSLSFSYICVAALWMLVSLLDCRGHLDCGSTYFAVSYFHAYNIPKHRAWQIRNTQEISSW